MILHQDKISSAQSLIELEDAVKDVLRKQKPMSVLEASQFLELAVPTLYSKVCRREIPFCKQAGRLYFFRDDLIDWIKEGANSPQHPQHRADQLLTRRIGGAK